MQKNSAVQSVQLLTRSSEFGQIVASAGSASMYRIECPCCGTTVARNAPVVDLNTNVISWRGIVRLSPQSAILAHVMSAELGKWHHRDDLLTKLYGHRDLDGPLRSFTTEMTRLRRKVRPISLLIETTRPSRSAASYRMVSL